MFFASASRSSLVLHDVFAASCLAIMERLLFLPQEQKSPPSGTVSLLRQTSKRQKACGGENRQSEGSACFLPAEKGCLVYLPQVLAYLPQGLVYLPQAILWKKQAGEDYFSGFHISKTRSRFPKNRLLHFRN